MEKLLKGARDLQSRLKHPVLPQVKFLPEVFFRKQREELRDDALVLMRLDVYISDDLVIIEQIIRILHMQLQSVIRNIEFQNFTNSIDNMLDSTIRMDLKFNALFSFDAEEKYFQTDYIDVRAERTHIG